MPRIPWTSADHAPSLGEQIVFQSPDFVEQLLFIAREQALESGAGRIPEFAWMRKAGVAREETGVAWVVRFCAG